MELALPTTSLEHYKSLRQIARVATEGWGEQNLYCPNCDSPQLHRSAANFPVIDFQCPRCAAGFQLKSQGSAFSGRIVDAAYSSMLKAIEEDRTPNLLALHYKPDAWEVRSLLLIPRFAFSASLLEKRKPLAAHARRAGWIGCNILLAKIPPDARIPMISDGIPADTADVRRQYARLRPLVELKPEQRGWTLDVLNVVRSLGKHEFSLRDVYAAEDPLARLHPANRHVRDKIRQQLQILRDLGLVNFAGGGNYVLR